MSFCVEFHPPGLPGTGQKVFGGGWWWVGGGSKVSLVFCFGPNLGLDLDQAEQKTVRLYSVHICATLYKETAGIQFSCIVYKHSTAALLPLSIQLLLPGWPGRGQLTPGLQQVGNGP